MKQTFREAFVWHLEHHQTVIADLVSATGVSRDVVNKLKFGKVASTVVENAMLIAAYYGKTIEQFMRCDDVSAVDQVHNLAALLTPSELQVATSTMQAMLRARGE